MGEYSSKNYIEFNIIILLQGVLRSMGHGGAKHITLEMFEPWEKYQGCVNFVRGPKDKRYPPCDMMKLFIKVIVNQTS